MNAPAYTPTLDVLPVSMSSVPTRRDITSVPSSSTYSFCAGWPSAYSGPGSTCSTWPWPHSQASWSSVSFSKRNSVRSSSGLHMRWRLSAHVRSR